MGVQALSSNVTAVHVTVTTLPTNSRVGTANPTNYYDVCLLRFGDAVGYFDAIPVVGGPQWLAVPSGATRCAYACKGGAVISLAEVIGGTPPFGSTGALSSLTDVALTSPADAQVLSYQASSSKWINSTPSGGGGAALPYVNVQQQAATGTSGGGFTSGSWQTHPLTTIQADSGSIASLSANQVTLPAGTYRARWSAAAAAVDRHQTRLQNATDGTTLGWGSASYASAGLTEQTASSGECRFTLAASKAIRIEHRCQTTRATDGFGFSMNWGGAETNVFAYVIFEKES